MPDTLTLALPLLAGVALGALYFGGLWWTIQRGLSSRRPAGWFVGSLLLRMAITLAGFYVVSGGHWDRLLACLVGFIVARLVATRLGGPTIEYHDSPAKDAGHAP